jgi:hypothetical protein
MLRWGTTKDENGFLFARGGSATRSHDPADHGSTGSAEEVIFKAMSYSSRQKRLTGMRSHLRNPRRQVATPGTALSGQWNRQCSQRMAGKPMNKEKEEKPDHEIQHS